MAILLIAKYIPTKHSEKIFKSLVILSSASFAMPYLL